MQLRRIRGAGMSASHEAAKIWSYQPAKAAYRRFDVLHLMLLGLQPRQCNWPQLAAEHAGMTHARVAMLKLPFQCLTLARRRGTPM